MKKQNYFNKIFYLIIIFSFFIRLTYLPNGFTWLDHRDIEAQRGILPLVKVHQAFSTRFADTGFYRPVVTILHSLDFALYKNWAPGYHLTNVLLHLGTTATLPFFLSVFLILSSWQILLATLIFTVHPFSILPVGTISYRPELLLAIFVFLSLHFYAKVRRSPNLKNTLLFFAFFSLALLSKETAIVLLPLLIVFWEYLNFKKLGRINFKLLTGVLFLYLIYFLLRFQAVPEVWRSKEISLPLFQTLGTRMLAFGKLLLGLFVPFKPGFSDATLIVGIFYPASLAVLFILIGVSLFLIRSRLRSQISISIFLLFLIFLTPSLNLVPLPRFYSPHYGYLAVSAFAILIVLLAEKFRGFFRFLYICIIIVWIFFASFFTLQAGRLFKNDLTLFQPEVDQDPNFLEAHYYLGYYYLSKKDLRSAKKHYQSILVQPKNVLAFADRFAFYLNLGSISLVEGRLLEAQNFFKRCKKYAVSPYQRQVLAYNETLLAKALNAAGKKQEAEDLIREILKSY